jgi:hypothetical protein
MREIEISRILYENGSVGCNFVERFIHNRHEKTNIYNLRNGFGRMFALPPGIAFCRG